MDGRPSESLERLRRCPVDDPMVEPLLRSLVSDPPFSISILRRCLKDWSTVTPYAEEVALAMARKAAGTADIVQLQMIYQLITRAERPPEAPRGGREGPLPKPSPLTSVVAAAVYVLLYGLHRSHDLVLHILRDVDTEDGTVLLLVLGASLCPPGRDPLNGIATCHRHGCACYDMITVPERVRSAIRNGHPPPSHHGPTWGTMCSTTKHLFGSVGPMLRREVVICLGAHLPLVSPRNLISTMSLSAAPHAAMCLYINIPARLMGEKDTFFHALACPCCCVYPQLHVCATSGPLQEAGRMPSGGFCGSITSSGWLTPPGWSAFSVAWCSMRTHSSVWRPCSSEVI